MATLREQHELLIEQFEPSSAEVVRVIEDGYGTSERIIKIENVNGGHLYGVYRYFPIGDTMHCSVDLAGVEADAVIQHLAERL